MSSIVPLSGLGREVKTTFTLAAPIILGHVSTGLIGLVDSLLAGRHGVSTLAAVAVGSTLWAIASMVLTGVLLALPTTVAQHHGAGRDDRIAPVFHQALWLALGLSAIMFTLLSFPDGFWALMNIAPDVRPGATAFVLSIRWAIPALALYLCMRYLSEGLHWTLPTMVFGLGGLVLLVPIGYILMFGRLGFPELGPAGPGYATAIILWVQVAAFALYLHRSKRLGHLRVWSHVVAPKIQELRALLSLGMPIGAAVFMEVSLFIGTALLIGGMGAIPVAAHQVAINIASISFLAVLGLSEATTVRVGHSAGSSHALGVRQAALAGFIIATTIQVGAGLVMIFGNHALARAYTSDPAVVALAAHLLLYAAGFQIANGIQAVSGGALRGLHDTRWPMVLTGISYWGVGMPVGMALSLGWGWGPVGMWCGLLAGVTTVAVLLTRRFYRLAPYSGAAMPAVDELNSSTL